jgi:hypothetical protein
MRLGVFDTNRLTELVSTYMKVEKEFTIFKNGELSLTKASFFQRILNLRGPDTRDFLDVVKTISEGIIGQKQNNAAVQRLCGEAMGILIDTNDRSKVIKLLYEAHLYEAQKEQRNGGNNNNKRPKEVSIEVRDTIQPRRVDTYAQVQKQITTRDVVNLVNSADQVYIVEE